LIRSTDKSQSYSIVRREASCFVSLNAPIGCIQQLSERLVIIACDWSKLLDPRWI